MSPIGVAIVGCGYVADYYLATARHYPHIKLQGVFDIDEPRLAKFCEHYDLKAYCSMQEVLEDASVQMVLNLTNPRTHYAISRDCLMAGKHVYSEKPLAMDYGEAEELVQLAADKRLNIAAAPCSLLGSAAKTLAYAVNEKLCGDIKLVYAELDDGLVHKMAFKDWLSESGAPWPYRDEFEVGCTLEHAGYVVSWLVKMFGAVASITAYSDCLISQKLDGEAPLEPNDTADTSFGILKFENGVVARLSTTIIAEHDHSIRIFGEKGVLSVGECWNNQAPVHFRKLIRIRRRSLLSPIPKRIKAPFKVPAIRMSRGNTHMDFMLGVQDLADAITNEAEPEIGARFSLHVTEVALALQNAGTSSNTYITKSRP